MGGIQTIFRGTRYKARMNIRSWKQVRENESLSQGNYQIQKSPRTQYSKTLDTIRRQNLKIIKIKEDILRQGHKTYFQPNHRRNLPQSKVRKAYQCQMDIENIK